MLNKVLEYVCTRQWSISWTSYYLNFTQYEKHMSRNSYESLLKFFFFFVIESVFVISIFNTIKQTS